LPLPLPLPLLLLLPLLLPLLLSLPFLLVIPEGDLLLKLFLLVILSEAKNPCIFRCPQNKSQIPAKSTASKKRHSANHLTQAIHHTLTTKTPPPNAKFPQNPL
jgi:hypothetical protein